MKIIIGIDDSPYSQAALQFAKKTWWPADTRFIVLSAAPILTMAYSFAEVNGYSAYQDLQEDQKKVHEEMASRAEQELRSAGFATQAKVEMGDPRDVIVRLAREEKADLVVVGSHGRTGMAKLLMGSVASHVVTHAPCSVLVAKIEPQTGKGA